MSTPIEIASFGHSGSHTSQLMHSSVINRAMLYSLRPASRRLFWYPRALVKARVSERQKRLRHRWVLRDRADLVLQALFHRWENELADIAAELRDLTHDRARDELILIRRRHEHGFHVRQQITIHARHLELVFEVGDGTQTPHDHARVVLAHEIFQ